MNRSIVFRIVVGVVVLVLLVGGAAGLGFVAYQAGVTQGMAQSARLEAPSAGALPNPYAGPFVHYGFWGPGLGLLNCLFLLLIIGFIFMVFRGLMFVVFGPRHWGGPRWAAGPGGQGEAFGWHHRPWDKGFPPMFDEWHRQAHARGENPSEPKQA